MPDPQLLFQILMFALLWVACVVNGYLSPVDRSILGNYPLADRPQPLSIEPIGAGRNMVQCLVPSDSESGATPATIGFTLSRARGSIKTCPVPF
jgi:hypothetical protein